MTMVFSLTALAIALVVGLGRQLTVFTAFAPGLVIFRRFGRTRVLALVAVGVLTVAAFALPALAPGSASAPAPPVAPLVAAWALIAFAFLFDLERLFPALREVRVVEPERAELDPGTTVLVAEVAGEPAGEVGGEGGAEDQRGAARRAYPLERMVMARHLVHDTLAGEPIVVTYCALCRSGLVFRAGSHEFSVVGVFRRNLIMEDAATGTLWQQATGEAIAGPLAGRRLELVSGFQMPWSQARELPGITLAAEPDGSASSPLSSNRGLSLLKWATEHVMAPGHTRLSSELAPRETVYGVVVDGVARAYPLSRLGESVEFGDRVGEVDVTVAWDAGRATLRVARHDGGELPVVERHWWLGWNEFHPATSVWRPDATADRRSSDGVRSAP